MPASLGAVRLIGILVPGLVNLHCGGRRHDKLVAFA